MPPSLPPTLRALLEHVIDYAGLFPPARLPLAESLRNYLAYRASGQSWMLGGFVCPVGRLSELAALLPAREPGSMLFDCCVVASSAASLNQAAETLLEDLRRAGEFARAISDLAAQANPPRLSL